MKTHAPRWKRLYRHVLNIHIRGGLTVFIVAGLSAAPVYATNGVVRFHGSITQASCEVRASLREGGNDRLLSVAPGVTLSINTLNNVCSAASVPFSVGYRQLPVSATTVDKARQGVVTLTYD